MDFLLFKYKKRNRDKFVSIDRHSKASDNREGKHNENDEEWSAYLIVTDEG